MVVDNSETLRHVQPGDCIIGLLAWDSSKIEAWNTRDKLVKEVMPALLGNFWQNSEHCRPNQ